MKKSAILIAAVAAMCLVFAGVAIGQTGWTIGVPAGLEGGGPDKTPAMTTLSGTVAAIQPIKGVKDGLQMRVKDAQGSTTVVYMGPKWFIQNQRIKFAKGDQVEVRGAKVIDAAGRISVVAVDISKGDWTMKLRNDDDGMPAWECCFPKQKMKEE